MSLEYKPSLGFVETAGLVIAIQVADAMAKAAGADVFPVDMGMIDTVPQVRNEKVAHGTADITQGPAMSRQQAERAVLTGLKSEAKRS
mgnify:CR=1 FL=1